VVWDSRRTAKTRFRESAMPPVPLRSISRQAVFNISGLSGEAHSDDGPTVSVHSDGQQYRNHWKCGAFREPV